MKFCVRALFAVCFLSIQLIFGHGFIGNTPIHLASGKLVPIKSLIVPKVRKKCIFVESYDYNDHHLIAHRLVEAGRSISPWCVRLGFDDNSNNDIICTPTQTFYSISRQWVITHDLFIGDELIGLNNTLHKVTYKKVLPSPHNVYTFEVEKTHTFFVGKQGLLTHNMALPTSLLCEAGISMGGFGSVIGSLCSSPITIAIALIVGAGCAIAKLIKRKKIRKYKVPIKDVSVDQKIYQTLDKNSAKKKKYRKKKAKIKEKNSRKKKGIRYSETKEGKIVHISVKPTKEDGFEAAKNWDGKKVKDPNGEGFGWPDKKGNVWIPASGSSAHGGYHWDVQCPDGSYVNRLPGGRIRGEK